MVINSEFAVEHIGTVVSTGGRGHVAMVKVSRGEDCAGCKIAGMCRGDGAVTLRAAVDRRFSGISGTDAVYGRSGLSAGDRVRISSSRSASIRAAVLLFILPLAVMVATIVILSLCSDVTEGVIALSSVCAVGVTYVIMWISRRHIDKEIEWRIVEIMDRAADSGTDF